MLFAHLLLTLALAAGDGDLVEDFEGAGSESWDRVTSDSHPPYNIVERVHDPENAKSGNQYLHFRTLGGSTAVRRSSKVPWPADAGRPYRASVWVRLSSVRRNAATLSLTWLNSAGDAITEQRSAPLMKTEGWTLLSIEVPFSPPGTAGVLPGLHFEGPDVRGLCDFDLLEVVPVERLDVRPAGRAIAAFSTSDYPRFVLSPAGLPPGVHSITATLTLADGKTVVRAATIDLPSTRSVSVDFPPAPPGIHSLTASVDGRHARRSLAVLVAPSGQVPADLSSEERAAGHVHDSVESALQHRLLEPRRPFVLDRLFLDEDGQPTAGYFSLRASDRILEEAEPVADPGLFPSNVRVAAFRKGARMAFALWSGSGDIDLPLWLNEEATLQPGLAPARPLRPGERVRIGTMPVWILDVDPLLTELRLELPTAELPLQLSPARLTLRLRNASRTGTPRDLELTLGGLPAGWRASARRFQVASLPPDGLHEETLDLILPPSETERSVDLKFELSFTIQGREQTLQLQRSLSLKSPIRLETTLSAGPSRTLSVRVVNGTAHPMTLSLRSRIPGLAERLDLIRDLAPGSRSKPLEIAAPEPGRAELYAQEAGGDRAVGRREIPLP